MCFFCETVSALLRHPYICTHRCAFNADIYVYIIFGPLKSFTNSSRWAFIYPCPATTPPHLEMHLFQLPQLLRSWSKSGDLLLRRGGNSLPERLDLWDEFHDSFEWFKTRTTTGLSIFLGGLIMEVEEMDIGSLQDYSPFTRRGILNLHDEGRKGM